jgi:hypothetical protein
VPQELKNLTNTGLTEWLQGMGCVVVEGKVFRAPSSQAVGARGGAGPAGQKSQELGEGKGVDEGDDDMDVDVDEERAGQRGGP